MVGARSRALIATEMNERKIWPLWSRARMSSQKFSRIQSHSISFGLDRGEVLEERQAEGAGVSHVSGLGAGELLHGVYCQQPLLPSSTTAPLCPDPPARRASLIVRFPLRGEVPGAAVRGLQIHVLDFCSESRLRMVVADKGGDELEFGFERRGVLRRVVLGEEAA